MVVVTLWGVEAYTVTLWRRVRGFWVRGRWNLLRFTFPGWLG